MQNGNDSQQFQRYPWGPLEESFNVPARLWTLYMTSSPDHRLGISTYLFAASRSHLSDTSWHELSVTQNGLLTLGACSVQCHRKRNARESIDRPLYKTGAVLWKIPSSATSNRYVLKCVPDPPVLMIREFDLNNKTYNRPITASTSAGVYRWYVGATFAMSTLEAVTFSSITCLSVDKASNSASSKVISLL